MNSARSAKLCLKHPRPRNPPVVQVMQRQAGKQRAAQPLRED